MNLYNQELKELFHLTSIGKLVKGFTHNANGSLQNPSMDIEILILTLADDNTQNGYTSKVIFNHLKRLQEDFDKINKLLKISFDITSKNKKFINIQPLNDLLTRQKNMVIIFHI